MKLLCGFDIGGTKCAVVLGRVENDDVKLVEKVKFPTCRTSEETISALAESLDALLRKYPEDELAAIGISCGGPLDSRRGRILSPPNLPGWDDVDVFTPFVERFQVPIGLQNDANACALAEWRWGAGRGTNHMVFLTFGTGMGAGLILNGRLYSGANDMAGEVGHVRLAEDGPEGYGKAGSFEGFCSGGGIEREAKRRARERFAQGGITSFCSNEAEIDAITAERVAKAAIAGDALALDIFDDVGHYLGRGLALLIDILNPERIVIGSIYARQQALLDPVMLPVLREECLGLSRSVCEIVPAGLGEHVGDFASLSVAAYAVDAND
ncbi:ROK family protein [Alicyclobacillus acidiphilus]|uniref:ROK family protein n=1 Tax=Alicyclobacillus acidiphilus TaxID=182455 RepID=UPI00082D603B|nr:ROK family protein [Alicyclobacillus acidiphilus]